MVITVYFMWRIVLEIFWTPPLPHSSHPPKKRKKKNWMTYKWNKIILFLDSTAVAYSRIESHHHAITVLEKYVAAILHVGINDLLRLDKSSTILGSICNDIFNGVLRCRNFNIGKYLFQSWYSVQKILQIC